MCQYNNSSARLELSLRIYSYSDVIGMLLVGRSKLVEEDAVEVFHRIVLMGWSLLSNALRPFLRSVVLPRIWVFGREYTN